MYYATLMLIRMQVVLAEQVPSQIDVGLSLLYLIALS